MKAPEPSFAFLIDGKPVDDGALSRLLPTGLSEDAPKIAYADYFHAIAEALRVRAFEPICRSLHVLTGESFPPDRVREVHIDSVKHGALYHVAKVTVGAGGRWFSMAMNSAVHPTRRAALEREWATLQSLAATTAAPCVPKGLYLGEGMWRDATGEARPFWFFLARWFDGFHEWHLEKGEGGLAEIVRVWDGSAAGSVLTDEQASQLMEQAAYILTLALDRWDFRHIHPWHHAAGDFVVAVQGQAVAVRLVAARNLRVLVPPGPERHERLSAVAAFFFALTFRLRLDRDRGTGHVVWAPGRWLAAVVRGFLRGWTDGAPPHEDLSAEEILAALRAFDPSEWQAVGRLLADDLTVDPDEEPLLSRLVADHALDLHQSLRSADLFLRIAKDEHQ
uniref:Uncharacterized protein n=1 Tax=Desulfacinum infernum TaxID=35837 RepID=A0A831ZJ75_9BACT